MKALTVTTLAILRQHRRSLMIFYLFFAGLALSALTPVFSTALAGLRPITGQAAISTGGLVEFLVSPGGLAWLVASLTVSVLLVVLQQAGMTLIAASRSKGEYRIALTALWGLARRFKSLLILTVLQVGGHLVIALPFLAVIVLAYQLLLSPYDLYYLRLQQPPVLWWFLGISSGALVGIICCNGWLFLHWILSVPLLMLENLGARSALKQSGALARGHRLPATGNLLSGLALLLALPFATTLLFQLIGEQLVARIPGPTELLLTVITAYLALYLLFTITLGFLAIAAYSVLIYSVYRRATGNHHRPAVLNLSSRAGPLAWSAEALVILLAMTQAWWVLQPFEQQDEVSITAHRGSAFKAPENTLSAIQQAIDDGADYIEIDVRQTADGVPVLWHDSSTLRVFGIPGKISDLSYAEARSLDAGSWFSPTFAGETIATLEQAIAQVRGQARLYIDIKPDPETPDLARNVVGLLQEEDFIEGTIIAAADSRVLREVKELEPELQTTLLALFVVGPLKDDYFDVLGLRKNRVNPATVANTHRKGHELHVWTVNSSREMSRFIDMGVDNIITDRPELLAELLRQRAGLSDAELLALKVRNWLR